MPHRGYIWRRLTDEERAEVLATRQKRDRPWHSPPHWQVDGVARFHLTAACYEHAPHIGASFERLGSFSDSLLQLCESAGSHVCAWCVLPNHYHILLKTDDVSSLLLQMGRFHGRTAYAWNLADDAKGRKVFFRATERRMRSDRHFWATMNYIHHNPVRHGYVERWQEWAWSSASGFLHSVGAAEAARIWKEYPVGDYGEGWDDPGL